MLNALHTQVSSHFCHFAHHVVSLVKFLRIARMIYQHHQPSRITYRFNISMSTYKQTVVCSHAGLT